jgi:hypothetical protein
MSKTISFVASDQLAEFLERESKKRMTTVSSTAQQLLAEKYREDHAGEEAAAVEDETNGTTTDEERPDTGDSDLPAVFDRQADHWYIPDSEQDYIIAVRMPEDANTGRKYFKTVNGAAKRLRREYE